MCNLYSHTSNRAAIAAMVQDIKRIQSSADNLQPQPQSFLTIRPPLSETRQKVANWLWSAGGCHQARRRSTTQQPDVRTSYPRQLWAGAAIVLLGAFGLEVLQELRPDRHGRAADALVKAGAACPGLGLGWLASKLDKRRASSVPRR